MKIEYREAEGNPLFPPQITALIRLVLAERGPKRKCPVCQKQKRDRAFWTMLAPFKAGLMSSCVVKMGELLPALTAVCGEHPLEPDPALMPGIMCEMVE